MCHSWPFIVRKMTLFWHGHFATSAEKVSGLSDVVTERNLSGANAPLNLWYTSKGAGDLLRSGDDRLA